MKIAAVGRRKSGDRTVHAILFERDGMTQAKSLLSTPPHFRYALEMKAREADRDIAYQLHGEAWRLHVELSHETPKLISDEEHARWAHLFEPL